MTRRPVPYLGISGVVDPADAVLLKRALVAPLRAHRALLLGVKATHKTQYLDQPNKYGPDWYPVGDTIHAALPQLLRDPIAAPGEIFGVAQVYLEPTQVDDPSYRRQFTNRLLRRSGRWLAGIQFDMLPWHTAAWAHAYLGWLGSVFPGQVLLQCHGPAMTELGPDGVAAALAEIAGHVDYVLFDSSHGTGTRLDVDTLGTYLDAVHTHRALGHLGFAVAGGLGPDTVTDLAPLLLAYPDLSWDAEAALHPATTGDSARPLSLTTAVAYLDTSATLVPQRA